jgi:hypothetical protein
MEREIDGFGEWLRHTLPGQSEGFYLGPCGVSYADELLRDMRVRPMRRRHWLADEFLPAWPSNYATLAEERRARDRSVPPSFVAVLPTSTATHAARFLGPLSVSSNLPGAQVDRDSLTLR